MSDQFTPNTTPASGSVALYSLIAKLIASSGGGGGAGWSQQGSGDASTFSNSAAGPVVSGASGATGLANNSAWVRVRMPIANSVTREVVFQRGTNNLNWRIKYSRSAGFSGGSPSATQTPSATDEVYVLGGGTDASPTFTALFGADNTYRAHVLAQNAAPYGFAIFGYTTGGGSGARFGLVLDPIANPIAEDTDPYVWYAATVGANSFASDFGSESSAFKAFLSTTYTSGNFVVVPTMQPFSGGGTSIVANMPANPFHNKHPGYPILYARRSGLTAPTGEKGYSGMMEYVGVADATGSTHSIASSGAKDRIVIGNVRFRWNGSSPTV